MILQTIAINTMIGLGLSFGLSIMMLFFSSRRSLVVFLSFLMISIGFMVYGGLLELWVLILNIILVLIIILFKRGRGDSLA